MQVIYYFPEKCDPPSAAPHGFDRLILQPGENQVSDSDAAMLRSHPAFPRFVEWGAIAFPPSDNPDPVLGDSSDEPSAIRDTDTERPTSSNKRRRGASSSLPS